MTALHRNPLVLASPSTRPGPAELADFFDYLGRRVIREDEPDNRELQAFWCYFAHLMRPAQVFEFGDLPERAFKREACRGGDLIGEGYLRPPYEACLFYYTLTGVPDPTDTRDINLATDGRLRYFTAVCGPISGEDVGGGHADSRGAYFVADFIRLTRLEDFGFRSHRDGTQPDPGSRFWLCGGAAVIDTLKDSRWSGWLMDGALMEARTPEEEAVKRTTLMGSLADGIAALSMMLCTKNIRLRREDPPPKVQAKRARAGHRPLVTVTHVDARGYFEAAARTDRGGTHASPVPHLRRGHLRHYRDGHKTWVRPMLINCRSLTETAPRDHYEVKAV